MSYSWVYVPQILSYNLKGSSGLQVVEQGLKRGHHVTALVRDKSKLSQFADNANFKSVECNVLNSEEVSKHLEGQDAVLSALGIPGIKLFKISFYLDSIKSITDAMKKANLKRLVCMTSFYSKRMLKKKPSNIFLIHFFFF